MLYINTDHLAGVIKIQHHAVSDFFALGADAFVQADIQ